MIDPIKVTIHCNTETEEYTVSASGYDDFSTNDEVEARDEAESIACQIEDAGGTAVIEKL